MYTVIWHCTHKTELSWNLFWWTQLDICTSECESETEEEQWYSIWIYITHQSTQEGNVNLTSEILSSEGKFHAHWKWFHSFSFSPHLLHQGAPPPFNNRCSSLCCCLRSTSSFRLRHIEQRADSTYWIHKNNKPIKNCRMNNSATTPRGDISLLSWHIWKDNKWQPVCFMCFKVLIVEVHTAGDVLCCHVGLWSSQRGEERL